MSVAIAGVDLTKNVFHIHAVDRRGEMAFRFSRKRDAGVDELCNRIDGQTVIAMEACVPPHPVWPGHLPRGGLVGAP